MDRDVVELRHEAVSSLAATLAQEKIDTLSSVNDLAIALDFVRLILAKKRPALVARRTTDCGEESLS